MRPLALATALQTPEQNITVLTNSETLIIKMNDYGVTVNILCFSINDWHETFVR